jgi:hypothetical protein
LLHKTKVQLELLGRGRVDATQILISRRTDSDVRIARILVILFGDFSLCFDGPASRVHAA